MKEFWIKRGFLDPKEGVVRLVAPTDWSGEYFEHIKILTPEHNEALSEIIDEIESLKYCLTTDGMRSVADTAVTKIRELIDS